MVMGSSGAKTGIVLSWTLLLVLEFFTGVLACPIKNLVTSCPEKTHICKINAFFEINKLNVFVLPGLCHAFGFLFLALLQLFTLIYNWDNLNITRPE